jgi:purine-nucleoside phosphorylase
LHEGFLSREVVFPIRVFAEVGVETLLFVNTAGSVDPVIESGTLALLTDHVNFQGVNPLVGPNVEDWGPRFPDMTAPYDAELRAAAEEAALQHGIKLHEGIYFAMLGPSAGTKAEYRMVQSLGANLVGTGTVPEVIAARHMGVRVLALSIVTEQCLPGEAASPEADEEPGETIRSRLSSLLQAIVAGE